ncbi:MAG TPA: DUF1236 domain-containing protein [Xanthobacteraceae bacterium]|jgi:hypothetical protein|nr:DUF1236 domain-containing protein [Xanthobacteraceae bacterium]
MRNKQTLLAGVAALALFAASGIASAQQTQQDQKGAGGAAQSSMQSQRSEQGAKNQGKNQGSNQTANQGLKNQGAQQGKNQNAKNQDAMSKQSSGQNAQNERKMQSGQGKAGKMSNAGKGGEKSLNRSAQEQKQNKGAGSTNRTAQGQQKQLNAQSKTGSKTGSQTGQFATQQGKQTQRGTSTAQRNEQMKGLQGSTRAPMQGATSTEQRSGGAANVSLNDQQRTQIRETVINSRGAPRASNVDFSVNVGTVVPRGHIHLVRVPETLIRIEPRWRHYLYFVYNDEIVIVDPRSMRIIDVLPV